MSRVKTFDSTGVAPNGRVYAGDLNAIQDQYADLYNIAQACGVLSLAVGEAGLILSRYGAGVLGLSGTMRATGKFNGVGGLQVNGVDLASTHLSDSAQLARLTDVNAIMPSGAMMPYGGSAAPSGWVLCQGQELNRTTYAALYAALGGAGSPWGQGNGTSTFNVPDLRGRVPVGKSAAGIFLNLAATGGEETHTLAVGEMPVHAHTLTSDSAGTPAGTISSVSAGTPAGTINAVSAGTPAGTISTDTAGTPAGTINSVSAGTPGGSINSVSAGTPAGSVASAGAHTHIVDLPVYDFAGGQAEYVNTTTGKELPFPTGNTESAGAHTHTFTGSAMAGHSHTFTGSAMAGHSHTFTGTAMTGHDHTFTGSAMGTHSHTFTGSALATHSHTFSGSALGTHTHTVGNAGSGTAHNNVQPYAVVNYIIKT